MTYYYTYRITCNHPESVEKYYYGFRKCTTQPKDDNYWSSSRYVKEAIAKYGINFFSKKIIKVFDSSDEALKHESKLHERFGVDKNPKFFNKCKSTIWGFRSTGLVLSGKTYEEIHGEEKSKLLKQSRSKALKEFRASNPESVLGENNPNYGNKWSAEKRAEFASKRQGVNHPAYGLIWINDGISNRKIRGDHEIPDGWVKGRLRTWKNQYGK